jgi:hypothetical protein
MRHLVNSIWSPRLPVMATVAASLLLCSCRHSHAGGLVYSCSESATGCSCMAYTSSSGFPATSCERPWACCLERLEVNAENMRLSCECSNSDENGQCDARVKKDPRLSRVSHCRN